MFIIPSAFLTFPVWIGFGLLWFSILLRLVGSVLGQR